MPIAAALHIDIFQRYDVVELIDPQNYTILGSKEKQPKEWNIKELLFSLSFFLVGVKT